MNIPRWLARWFRPPPPAVPQRLAETAEKLAAIQDEQRAAMAREQRHRQQRMKMEAVEQQLHAANAKLDAWRRLDEEARGD